MILVLRKNEFIWGEKKDKGFTLDDYYHQLNRINRIDVYTDDTVILLAIMIIKGKVN